MHCNTSMKFSVINFLPKYKKPTDYRRRQLENTSRWWLVGFDEFNAFYMNIDLSCIQEQKIDLQLSIWGNTQYNAIALSFCFLETCSFNSLSIDLKGKQGRELTFNDKREMCNKKGKIGKRRKISMYVYHWLLSQSLKLFLEMGTSASVNWNY